jgi:hypothetical protein
MSRQLFASAPRVRDVNIDGQQKRENSTSSA